MPFLTDVKDGTPSYSPAYNEIYKNFIMANYDAMGSIDNDDGSSWYDVHDNFFPYGGGMKMDFGGHDKKFYNNIIAQIPRSESKYELECVTTMPYIRGIGDQFYNNTCILYPN